MNFYLHLNSNYLIAHLKSLRKERLAFLNLALITHGANEAEFFAEKAQRPLSNNYTVLSDVSHFHSVSCKFIYPLSRFLSFPLSTNLSLNLFINLSKIDLPIQIFESVSSSLVCMCSPKFMYAEIYILQYIHAHKTYTLKQYAPLFCVHVYIAKMNISVHTYTPKMNSQNQIFVF